MKNNYIKAGVAILATVGSLLCFNAQAAYYYSGYNTPYGDDVVDSTWNLIASPFNWADNALVGSNNSGYYSNGVSYLPPYDYTYRPAAHKCQNITRKANGTVVAGKPYNCNF